VIRRLHEEKGTRFRFERKVRQLAGDTSVECVELDDGSPLPADLVVVGIGVRPDTLAIQMYPKNPDGGIHVDEYLRLNDDVCAAGDIACYPDKYSGERIRVEHWRVAQQQGRTAARNMVGPGLPFDAVLLFWTRQFGVTFTYAGHADEWDEVILVCEIDELDFSVCYAKDGRLQAIAGTQTEKILAFMERVRTRGMLAPDQILDRRALATTQ
jgi:NADPH-dependent 2,4-dienoyl-CoA reductase/sulfur reductase-like enzyme